MSALVKYDLVFEKHGVTAIVYKGRVCWIAREIGRLLGYGNDGKRLVTLILRKWRDEFIAGEER